MKRQMILALVHAYFVPPHCKARSRQQTAAINTTAPKGSRWARFSWNVLLRSSLPALRSLKKIQTSRKTTNPTGTLLVKAQLNTVVRVALPYIQKHHLQLTSVVSAPPRIGPKHVAIPIELTTMLKKSGLLSSDTESPTIHRAPWNSPAAPTPATARPNMNIGELGAAAHSIDPTITTHMSADSEEWEFGACRTLEEHDGS